MASSPRSCRTTPGEVARSDSQNRCPSGDRFGPFSCSAGTRDEKSGSNGRALPAPPVSEHSGGDQPEDEAWFLPVMRRVHEGEGLYRDVSYGTGPLAVAFTAPLLSLPGVEILAVKAVVAAAIRPRCSSGCASWRGAPWPGAGKNALPLCRLWIEIGSLGLAFLGTLALTFLPVWLSGGGAEVCGLRRAQQDNLPAPLRDPSYGRAWRNPSLSAASWFRPHPGAPPGSPFIICRPDCAARRPWISPRLSPSARPARRETIWALRDGRIRRVCCWRREWNLRPARIEAFVEQEMERVRTWASAPCIARDDQRPGFAFPA